MEIVRTFASRLIASSGTRSVNTERVWGRKKRTRRNTHESRSSRRSILKMCKTSKRCALSPGTHDL
eukprot:9488840-Pyramimonas_sp.AAC.1